MIFGKMGFLNATSWILQIYFCNYLSSFKKSDSETLGGIQGGTPSTKAHSFCLGDVQALLQEVEGPTPLL